MKEALCALLLVGSVAVAQAPAASSMNGKWKVHSAVAGNETDQECTFTQKDSEFTGSCTDEKGNNKITGKVDGSKVTWSYASDYNGTPLTVKFNGKLVDGKVTGETTVDPFGISGDFTATVVK